MDLKTELPKDGPVRAVGLRHDRHVGTSRHLLGPHQLLKPFEIPKSLASVEMHDMTYTAAVPETDSRGGVPDVDDEQFHLQRRSCWSQKVRTYPSSVPARARSSAATQTFLQAAAFGHFGHMTSCVTDAICVRTIGSPS